MRLGYCSALLLVLAACGGGGGGGTNTPATGSAASNTSPSGNSGTGTTAPAPARRLLSEAPQVVDYYGDSTIYGWRTGTSNGEPRVEPNAVDAFRANIGQGHQVNNLGRSGTTACDLLSGYGWSYEWPQQLDERPNTTVVIINHGINDTVRHTPQQYEECLSRLTQTAREKGKYVILETPNPINNEQRDRLPLYVDVMRRLVSTGQADQLIDQYKYLRDYMQLNNRDITEIVPDGLHPANDVYVLKGQEAARRFKEMPAK